MAKDFLAERVQHGAATGSIVTSIEGDPRTVGVASPVGGFCIRRGTVQWFRKTGAANTAWTEIFTTGPIETELFEILMTLREIRDGIAEIVC